jgi:oligosaccharide repeat unit polymerase
MGIGTIALVFAWCVAAWHLKRSVTLRISTTSLLFGGLLVIHGPSLLSYLYLTGPGSEIYESALERLDRGTIIDRVQLAVAVMFLCLTLGSFVATGLFPSWTAQIRRLGSNWRSAKIRHVLRNSSTRTLFYLLIILVLAAVALVEDQPAKILGFYSSPLSAFEKTTVRNATGGSTVYIYNLFIGAVGTFLAMVAFTTWKYERGHHFVGLITAATCILLFVAKLATLNKAPPVVFLLQFLLLYMVLTGKTFSIRTVLTSLVVTAAAFAVIIKVTFPELNSLDIFQFLYYRIFEIPNEVLLEYFAAIPAWLPYEWGTGLFGFLRGTDTTASIPTYLTVAAVTRGNLDSSSNAMFIADAWAQFSWVGIALFSFLAGAIVRSIDLYAFGRGFTDETAAIIAACSYGVLLMLSTSLTTALISGGLALIPLLSFVISGRWSAVVERRRDMAVAAGKLE